MKKSKYGIFVRHFAVTLRLSTVLNRIIIVSARMQPRMFRGSHQYKFAAPKPIGFQVSQVSQIK